MPEMLEVEIYRRAAATTLGRTIEAVDTPDRRFVKGVDAATVHHALAGRRFVRDRRIGKLLLLDTDREGPTLGLRFGMTGVLIVDGDASIDGLVYGARRDDAAWDRFVVHFTDGGSLRINDPRRFGSVEFDPDETRLGPDAASIDRRSFASVLASSAAPVKARLMDQGRIAGLGNLLTDEALWRAGIDPLRPARSLDGDEVAALHRAVRATLRVLGRRGGSHTGDLMDERRPGGMCPRCGRALERRSIGGRTTWSCPSHQV